MKNMKKSKGTKELGKKEREKRAKLNRIIFGFVMAVILFVALVTIENAVIKNEIKVDTVVATQDIDARTVIDAEKVSEYFKVIQLPEAYRPSNALENMEALENGIVTTEALVVNSVVSNGSFTSRDDIVLGIEDPVEVSINLGAIEDAVAGKVRAGDIVNISKVWPESTGLLNEVEWHSEYIVENAYVVESHTGTPAVTREDKETSVTLITVYVPRAKELEISRSIAEGTLRVGIVQESDGTEYIINGDIIATNKDTSVTVTDKKEESTVDVTEDVTTEEPVVDAETTAETVEVTSTEGTETPVEGEATVDDAVPADTTEDITNEEGSETNTVE